MFAIGFRFLGKTRIEVAVLPFVTRDREGLVGPRNSEVLCIHSMSSISEFGFCPASLAPPQASRPQEVKLTDGKTVPRRVAASEKYRYRFLQLMAPSRRGDPYWQELGFLSTR